MHFGLNTNIYLGAIPARNTETTMQIEQKKNAKYILTQYLKYKLALGQVPPSPGPRMCDPVQLHRL